MKTYKELIEFLNIIVPKHLNDGFAALTHYWQSDANYEGQAYETSAKDYFNEIIEDQGVDMNFLSPSEYDVPFPPPNNPKFTFIDLFAGIGGMRIAFQNLGGKCVFSSEWDKFAQQTYEANFGEVPFGDITRISEETIPDHDILIAGFPCQPFSIAGVSKKNSLGKKHGFLDETQGTLFFDIARILKHKKPPTFMLENVKNLLTHDKRKTFRVIKNTLEELGYSIFYDILNSKFFVPQNRARIFIIGFHKDYFTSEVSFRFPEMPEQRSPQFAVFKDILEKNVDAKYTLSDKLWVYLQDYALKHKSRGNGFGYGLTDMNGIARTISARYYKDGAEVLVRQGNKNPRRLTPRECARLQGYEDIFDLSRVSDNQAYKQFGNSVTVPLIQAIGVKIAEQLTIINEPGKTKVSVC